MGMAEENPDGELQKVSHTNARKSETRTNRLRRWQALARKADRLTVTPCAAFDSALALSYRKSS